MTPTPPQKAKPSQKETPSDIVSVTIGPYEISGWVDVEIRCGIDLMPMLASLSLTRWQPVDGKEVPITEGAPCQLKIDGEPLLTGYVVAVTENWSAGAHILGIQVASKSVDLTECSAELTNVQLNSTNALAIIRHVCAPFGIHVTADAGIENIDIMSFSIILTETPYEIIDRVCRLAGLVFYDQPDGTVHLAKIGTQSMASGFDYGRNIESLSRQRSTAGRFSSITAVIQNDVMLFNTPNDSDYVSQMQAVTAPGCIAYDHSITRNRPLLIPVDLGDANYTVAKRRVAWEVGRRYGRSCPVRVVADSWRDTKKTLWQVNAMAPWTGQDGTGAIWLITEVSFRQGLTGTRADVTLMPKAAFEPQPILNPTGSAELMQALHESDGHKSYGQPSSPS